MQALKSQSRVVKDEVLCRLVGQVCGTGVSLLPCDIWEHLKEEDGET